MASQIVCGSAIKMHVSIDFFSAVLFSASSRLLRLVNQPPFLGHVSVYSPCCLHVQTAEISSFLDNNTA